MSSVTEFAQKVKEQLSVRPILPFGYPLDIGTIGVLEDDVFSPRGTASSLLHTGVGNVDESQGLANWNLTSGEDVKISFLASGQASKLFPLAPTAGANVEISFSHSDSFLASVTNLKIRTVADPAQLIAGMLDAYKRGTWRKNYCLVYQIVIPTEALVLLSRTGGTNLLLSANAAVAPQSLADVAGRFAVTYQNNDVLKLTSDGQPLFFNAYRVKESFWTGEVGVRPLGVGDPNEIFDVA